MNNFASNATRLWIKYGLLVIAVGSVLSIAWFLLTIIYAPAVPAPVAQRKPAMHQKLATGETTLFPHARLVALYGAPDTPALGALGEQSMAQTFKKIRQIARSYQPHTKQKVYPALEIIATVAAAEPTANNDYSREFDMRTLERWVRTAETAGIYVVLDLQPGRSDFLTQAKLFEKLLRYPHVGLALDPEWRLSKKQHHLEQIGSVKASEVNQTAAWLAGLVKRSELPQKLFLLHQFRDTMITHREKLQAHPELAYVIQMDGHGAQSTKLSTWNAVRAGLPSTIRMGWKNFYNEDLPMLSPAQTYRLTPVPWFVSYQ